MCSVPAWQRALQVLPVIHSGRWAVTGSAALALYGFPVEPRDVDLLADESAAAELIDGLLGAVLRDESPWDGGNVRASRRALALVEGIEVEILVDVEAVGHRRALATPSLDQVDQVIVAECSIPVMPLSVILDVLDATDKRERAAMVREALGRDVGPKRPPPARPEA